jgi:hypothetical protein
MKLIKAEHPDKGIWYFSSKMKLANYINSTPTLVIHVLSGIGKRAKGWSLEYTEDGAILNKFIDPEK